MIWITRLNQKNVVLNSDLIEQIESTPDTVITLTTGQKITALESPEHLVEQIREYRRSLQFGRVDRIGQTHGAVERSAG